MIHSTYESCIFHSGCKIKVTQRKLIYWGDEVTLSVLFNILTTGELSVLWGRVKWKENMIGLVFTAIWRNEVVQFRVENRESP